MIETGLFGKAPGTGDFVSRGLQQPVRKALDQWVTAHLVSRDEGWPAWGVRGLLSIKEHLVLMVAIHSQDAVGRRYPLIALTNGSGVSLETADAWCDQAVQYLGRAADGKSGIEETFGALLAIQPQVQDVEDGEEALWVRGGELQPCDRIAVDELFSSG